MVWAVPLAYFRWSRTTGSTGKTGSKSKNSHFSVKSKIWSVGSKIWYHHQILRHRIALWDFFDLDYTILVYIAASIQSDTIKKNLVFAFYCQYKRSCNLRNDFYVFPIRQKPLLSHNNPLFKTCPWLSDIDNFRKEMYQSVKNLKYFSKLLRHYVNLKLIWFFLTEIYK